MNLSYSSGCISSVFPIQLVLNDILEINISQLNYYIT